MTTRQIAKELGISQMTAVRDVQLVRAYWQEGMQASREEWQARIVSTYEQVSSELWQQWERWKDGKVVETTLPDGTRTVRREPADPKILAGIVATTRELATTLGVREGADTVARVQVDQETRAALAPMDRDSYLALVANGMPSITVDARPRTEGAIDVEPIELARE